jgi:hypothetical protein
LAGFGGTDPENHSSVGVPDVLNSQAGAFWLSGTGDYEVRAGDMWTLAWDGELLGHVLVASVKDGFFLGWPVGLPSEPSFAPGILVESSLGVTVTVWPTMETGLGLHLLERPLGHLLPPREIRRIAACLDEDEEPDVQVAHGFASEPGNLEAAQELNRHWTELCFHTGRSDEGSFFLSKEKVQKIGGSARGIADALHLSVADVRTFWDAEEALPGDLAGLLLDHLEVSRDQIQGYDPSSTWWHLLAHPGYKADVEWACNELQTDEESVRTESARSAYALAARQDSDEMMENKLRNAVRRTVQDRRI